ncbi:MAG: hypothetical protein ACXVXP_05910 [Mycobacteriaceae bacterium]
MSVTQTIANTRLTGTQTFPFTNSQAGATNALVTIDRTVTGGLNSLTTADTLVIEVQRSLDGTTWQEAGGITCQGGVIVTKGVTLAKETLSVGLESVGEAFQIITTASTPVRIAGTVVYS